MLIGIANPSPSTLEPDDLATTIPIRFPCPSKRPPPEFPGLIDVSVWISFIALPSTLICLSRALMIPAETLPPSSPSGLPIATA